MVRKIDKINDSYKAINILVFFIATLATVTQLVFIKEFFALFYGNEFSYVTVFGSWLLLVSIGSFIYRFNFLKVIKRKIKAKRKTKKDDNKKKNNDNKENLDDYNKLTQIVLQNYIVMSLLSFVLIVLLRILRNVLFLPGILISIKELILVSLIFLAPFCILYGNLLSFLAKHMEKEKRSISKLYLIDNLGNFSGAIIFSVLTIFLTNLKLISFINLIISSIILILILTEKKEKSKTKVFPYKYVLIIVIITILFLISYISNIEKLTLSNIYSNEKIILIKNSQFGRYILTSSFGELNLYQDSRLILNSLKTPLDEELTHYALAISKNHNKILLIEPTPFMIKEVLKYNPKNIDIIEKDKTIVNILKNHFNLSDSLKNNSKIKIEINDPIKFLREKSEELNKNKSNKNNKNINKINNYYDTIIINSESPLSLEETRYYTLEFFSLIRRVSNNNTIIILPIGDYSNYLSEESINEYRLIKETLSRKFNYILLVPGEKVYTLASNSKISFNKLIKNLKESNIKTDYLKDYTLKDLLDNERINTLNKITKINKNKTLSSNTVNTVNLPRLFIYSFLRWTSMFTNSNDKSIRFFLILPSIIIFIIILLFLMKKESYIIFSSAFTSSSIQIIMLILFQLIFGSLYFYINLLIASSLLGLTLGGYMAYKRFKKLNRKIILLSELTIIIILIIVISIIKTHYIITNQITYLIFTALVLFLIHFLISLEFPTITKIYFKEERKTFSQYYSIDLISALLGLIVTTFLLIPLFGIKISLFILLILKIVSFVLYFKR